MSANNMWTSRYENEEGYGDTFFTWGTVNIIDGRVYIESVPLSFYLREYEGKNVALEVVLGLKRFENYGPDKNIEPLVAALKNLGVRTLMSCQGHIEIVDNKFSYLCPMVDVATVDIGKLPTLPANWILVEGPWGEPSVTRLRYQTDATNQTELDQMHKAALELAQELA